MHFLMSGIVGVLAWFAAMVVWQSAPSVLAGPFIISGTIIFLGFLPPGAR